MKSLQLVFIDSCSFIKFRIFSKHPRSTTNSWCLELAARCKLMILTASPIHLLLPLLSSLNSCDIFNISSKKIEHFNILESSVSKEEFPVCASSQVFIIEASLWMLLNEKLEDCKQRCHFGGYGGSLGMKTTRQQRGSKDEENRCQY